MRRIGSLLVLGLTAIWAGGCAKAQSQSPTPQTREGATPPQGAGANARGARPQDKKPKPYKDVITAEAKTDSGMFLVHRIEEKLFFEIPKDMLDKEMLLVTRVARTHTAVGYGGEEENEQTVRWERQDNKVLLRVVSHVNVASDSLPIAEAVRNSNFEPIVQAFDIEALSADSTNVVIEVTGLYTKDVPMLGMDRRNRDTYKVRRLDESRSFLVSARSYPQNIEVRHVLTYDAAQPPANASTGSISLEMNQSMILLPERPDDGAAVRRAGGLLRYPADRLRPRRAAGHGAALHRALAARAQGHRRVPPWRARGAGEADRVLHRPGDSREVAAVPQAGHRGLERRLRGGRLQERHPCGRTRRPPRKTRSSAPRTCATP